MKTIWVTISPEERGSFKKIVSMVWWWENEVQAHKEAKTDLHSPYTLIPIEVEDMEFNALKIASSVLGVAADENKKLADPAEEGLVPEEKFLKELLDETPENMADSPILSVFIPDIIGQALLKLNQK